MTVKQIAGWAAGVMLVATRAAEAHPGHGAGGGSYSLQHYLTEPVHAVVLGGLVILMSGLIVWRWRQGRSV
jgi:hypothetical protein